MKQKLLVAALATAFAAPAMADVTISGVFNPGVHFGSVTSSDAKTNPVGGTSAAADSLSTSGTAGQYSHLTVTSTEDLGNGNSVVGFLQIRSQSGFINGQNLNDPLTAFRMTVGMKGEGWGELKIGRDFSPYTWQIINNDPHDGAASVGAGFTLMGNAGPQFLYFQRGGTAGNNASYAHAFFGVQSNAIYYDSPNLAGFKVKVSYSMAGFDETRASGTNSTEFGGSVNWAPEDLPFFLGAVYTQRDDYNGAAGLSAYYGGAGSQLGYSGSKDKNYMLGGGVTFGDFKISAWWEQSEWKSDVTSGLSRVERSAFWLAGNWTLPMGKVGVSYSQAGDLEGNVVGGNFDGNSTGAKSFAVSYYHNLSKQTSPFIMFQQTNNDDKGAYTAVFAPSAVSGALGFNSRILMIGLKHAF